LRIRTLG